VGPLAIDKYHGPRVLGRRGADHEFFATARTRTHAADEPDRGPDPGFASRAADKKDVHGALQRSVRRAPSDRPIAPGNCDFCESNFERGEAEFRRHGGNGLSRQHKHRSHFDGMRHWEDFFLCRRRGRSGSIQSECPVRSAPPLWQQPGNGMRIAVAEPRGIGRVSPYVQ